MLFYFAAHSKKKKKLLQKCFSFSSHKRFLHLKHSQRCIREFLQAQKKKSHCHIIHNGKVPNAFHLLLLILSDTRPPIHTFVCHS